ncbi:hypothetical protein [Streptomyces cadmiisoli]|uniref:hypothetical protein n=1 Tax=Streptomyces cadmiisoli TaxID=2184053 RepID=UPI003655211C
MTGGFLGELGKRLAEKWLSLLVLPGALFLAVAAAGRVLGHGHPFDVDRLTDRVTAWAKAPVVSTVGGQVVLIAAILLGAAAAGVVAQALGSALERVVLAAGWQSLPGPLRRPVRAWVERRQRRWEAARDRYRSAREAAARALVTRRRVDPGERHGAYRAMARIAPERPDRPTWSGDRLHAVAVRLDRDLDLDLAVVWPVLWMHVAPETRAEITAGRQAVTSAAALGGWALLYLPLLCWWWPAAVIAAGVGLTSRARLRAALEGYAQTVEATARLHAAGLARELGVGDDTVHGAEAGAAVTRHLRGHVLQD